MVFARRIRERGLYDLLRLDPYVKKDRLMYSDAAVVKKLTEDPSAAAAKYRFLLNGKNGDHYPLMMLCALEASKEAIMLAFDAYPFAIHETDSAGWTPLHRVCSNGTSTEVLRFLASKAGMDAILAKSYKDLWTPLHLLCRYGAELDKVKTLVQVNQLCVVAATSNGSLPLHLAILHDAPIKVIQYLVETNGLTTTTPTKDGHTPLQYAQKKLPRNVVRDMKRASLSAKSIRRPTTRVELDRIIAELEKTIEAAKENVNVNTTMLDNAISAKEQVSWLYPLRDSMPSQVQLESSIAKLTVTRDSLRCREEFNEAQEVQASIEKIKAILDKEIEAERQIDLPKDIEQSRQLLLKNLSSSTVTPATRISLAFIERATENFSQKNLIGKGGFGEVFVATDVVSGVSFAVKKILPSTLFGDFDGRMRENIQAEIEGLSKFWHHNIVRLLGYHITDNNSEPQCLVYELAAGGSLSDLIATPEGRKALTWRKRVRTAFAIASAELYLCSQQCYHRDIKPQNICYWADLEKVILIDYGIAEFMDSQSFQSTLIATRFAGSRSYAAPEYLDNNQFGEKSEVYSIGMVLKVLITGRLAESRHRSDSGEPKEHKIDLFNLDQVDALAGNWDPAILESLKSLTFICTQPDRNDRPSMQELFNALDDIENRSHRVLSALEQTSIDSALSVSVGRSRHGVDLAPPRMMQCLFCNRKSMVGLLCPDRSNHFSCRRCFTEHVIENIGEEHIHCRSEGCRSPPYTLEQIYTNASKPLFSRHWELQQKNIHYARQARHDEAFVNKIVQAVGSKIDESLRITIRCLEMIGENELDCPKLCLVIPGRSERGDSSILRTIRTLPETGYVQVLLYFVCASEMVPIDVPIRLSMPKKWLTRVAFAIKATIMVLNLSTLIAGVPFTLPIPGDTFKEQIRCLDEIFSEFITREEYNTLQSVVRDSGNVSAETWESLKGLREEIRELSKASYQAIAQVAGKNVEWREFMELCANKLGVVAWVLKRNADTWRNSS